ncbi:hypothetical protein ACTTAF_06545 [Rhodobacter capsulatus]|uniref:hypothetical protein n=1 Tax=Rhodobacter capsulatus TaxID=1061 RepID=UPI0003D37409|nr:hypothetical protein [Rhodobacter capsulatus]ETD85808.1 hypothetical protein U703_02080 [Rhodobacter capsulatus YW1]
MFILSPLDEGTRLKSYSATVRGTASVIKIEIECSDHDEFSWRLRALAEIEAEQKAQKAAKAKPRKAAPPRLALPAPVKALPPPKGGEA